MSNSAKSVQSVKLHTSTNKDTKQVELFELDGVAYTIPDKIRFNISLKVLDVIDQKGETAGNVFMLKELLGEEAFEALTNYEDLTPETFNEIVELATKVVFGDIEGPKAS